jgi:hypothetical protein
MSRPLTLMLSISVMGLILSGCTLLNGDDPGESTEEPSSRSTEPAQTEPSDDVDGGGAGDPGAPESPPDEFFVPEREPGELFELLGPEDRIVVQSVDNNLSILTFAGEVAAPTANNANQPVFSPDGSVLAWTTFLPGGSSAGVAFADVAPDGSLSEPDVVPTPVISFYSVFAPGSSDRLAVLGNSQRGVGVAVVERSGSASDVLDEGVPYYFAWSPQGNGFVGHVGESLRQFDIGSGVGVDAFDVLPSFRVPGVLENGSAVYVTTRNLLGSAGMSAIVKVQPDDEGVLAGAETETVARFDGLGSLTISPDSSKMAILVEGTIGNARIGLQNNPALDRGLHVLDTGTDAITTVSSTAALAVFWSPNNQMLAALAFDSVGDGKDWARWKVYDLEGQIVSQSPRFLLSRDFVIGYLPFFDQYAESVSIWSPDSTRFVYAGESMAGDTGVWLHKLPVDGEDPKTYFVTEGAIALWSP